MAIKRNTRYRLTGSGNKSKNRPKKKNNNQAEWDYRKLAIFGGGLIVLIICIVVGIRAVIAGIGKNSKKGVASASSATENILQRQVFVDNSILISGMSREQAKAAILKSYPWDMKVKLSGTAATDDEYAVKNLVEPTVDKLLNEVYSGAQQENYNLEFTGLDSEIAAEVAAMAQKWNVKAKNGSIAGFDKETGEFLYDAEQNGIKINEEKLTQDIKAALEAKNFKTVITANSEVVVPEITKEQAKAMYKVIGTFTTTATANKDRNTNISLACQALDGLIIQPGAEFSFNSATGNRTADRGYKPAGAYLDGVLIEEPGGGVCQVSSTLYNAVVFAGLEPTERHAHTFEPTYCTPGEDAMVSYDGYAGPDMKFTNTSNTAIAIRAKFVDQKLSASIVGVPILEEGVKVSMESKKISENDSSVPQYEEDDSLPMGTSKEIQPASKGSRWETKRIVKRGNEIISSEFFHNSTYKGKGPIIKRNTEATAAARSAPEPSGSGGASGSSSSAKKSSKSSRTSASSETGETVEGFPDGSRANTRAGETTARSSGARSSSSGESNASKGSREASGTKSSSAARQSSATQPADDTVPPLDQSN